MPHPVEIIDVCTVYAAWFVEQFLQRHQLAEPVPAYLRQIVKDATFVLRLLPPGAQHVNVAMHELYLHLTGRFDKQQRAKATERELAELADKELGNMLKMTVSASTLMTHTEPTPRRQKRNRRPKGRAPTHPRKPVSKPKSKKKR